MQEVSLAVRILTALSRIHIVVFQDLQPSVILDNASSQHLEVCASPTHALRQPFLEAFLPQQALSYQQ